MVYFGEQHFISIFISSGKLKLTSHNKKGNNDNNIYAQVGRSPFDSVNSLPFITLHC